MTDAPAEPSPTEARPTSRSRRRLVALGVATAAVAALAGGAVYAATRLSGSDASDLARLVPADAAGFVALNLDPSASQKLALRDALGRLERTGGPGSPVSKDLAELDSVLDLVTCGDLSLADGDWAGDRAAAALLQGDEDQSLTTVVYVAAEDAAGARDAAKRLAAVDDCGDGQTVDARFVEADGGWLVASDGAMPVLPGDDGLEPLSEDEDFVRDVEGLGDEGPVTAWADSRPWPPPGSWLG